MSGTWAYKGCWNDNVNFFNDGIRAIPVQLSSGPGYSVSQCQTAARQQGYSTCSLQYGGTCFVCNGCDYTTYGAATGCSALGGAWTNQARLTRPAAATAAA
jgi:hypothetical protein